MTLKTLTLCAMMSCGLGAGLGACATPAPMLGSKSAVAANIEAQAITPPDEQKANVNIPADPTVQAAARKRYKEGTVKEPIIETTHQN